MCRYISGTFSKAQLNYPVHEKELYAALKTLKKWRIDLLPKKFTLRTDSTYVTGFLRNNLQVNFKQERLVRWQLEFSQFPVKIEYLKGEQNFIADSLIREWKQ